MNYNQQLIDICNNISTQQIVTTKFKQEKELIIQATQFLDDSYKMVTRYYCILNNVHNIPKCKCCNNNVTIKKDYPNQGFANYCSPNCSRSDKTINKETEKLLKDHDWLYNQRKVLNKSKEQIAKELKCSTVPITKWLKFHNIEEPLKDIKNTKEQVPPKEELEKLYETMTLLDIGKVYNVSNTTISKWFNDYNIQKREHDYNIKNFCEPKAKETNQERYGVDYTWQSENVKQKSKKTCFERYGVEYFPQTEDFKIKTKLTNLKRYGVENIFQLRDKINAGMLKKYGAISWLQTDKGKEYLRTFQLNRIKIPEFKHCILNNDKDAFIQIMDELFTKFNENKFLISDELGISYSTLCRYIKRFDLKERYISEYKNEKEIRSFLTELGIEFVTNDRKILKGKELDIYIPEYNIAIEHNGILFHSETYGEKDSDYHLSKTTKCENNNIKLFHINENEWNNYEKREVWKNILKCQLNKCNNIDVKNCEVIDVDFTVANDFTIKYSLEDFVESDYYKGIVYNNELICILSFNSNDIITIINQITFRVDFYVKDLLKYVLDSNNSIFICDRRYYSKYDKVLESFFTKFEYLPPTWNWFYLKNPSKTFKQDTFNNETMINNTLDRIWNSGYIICTK